MWTLPGDVLMPAQNVALLLILIGLGIILKGKLK